MLDELRAAGRLAPATRRRLARKAFAHTAAYDAAIVEWFDADEPLPPTRCHLSYERVALELRYGENPHQRAALYRRSGSATPWWTSMTQHSGLALSYLNLYDADAAWLLVHDDLVRSPDARRAAIIKHANPCGAAVAETPADAYQLAYECDERSAFGGIVAVDRPIDDDTVERMVAAAQADVVIAPAYRTGHGRAPGGQAQEHPDSRGAGARARRAAICGRSPAGCSSRSRHHVRRGPRPSGGSSPGASRPTPSGATPSWPGGCAAGSSRTPSCWSRTGRRSGIGAGQQNRVEAGQLAAQKAAGRAKGGACASDAFYPFPDGIEAAAEAGVAVVVQPGGAMRDDENIARADELGIAMVFTGERHFLH